MDFEQVEPSIIKNSLAFGPGVSTDPHPLNRSRHIRHPEPDCLTELEIRDQAGHPPRVELAAADFQVPDEFLFGHQVEFGARRSWVRVHARCCPVNGVNPLDPKI